MYRLIKSVYFFCDTLYILPYSSKSHEAYS
jgi:hypothetical protein